MTEKDEQEQGQFNTAAISEDETRYLEQTALLGLEYVLSDFAKQFQKSARRWELMAYPAMVVFGLLAISGFWLIYSLTKDMNKMSDSIDPDMGAHLGAMSQNISDLNASIKHMDKHIKLMSADVSQISQHIVSMDTAIQSMKGDISHMAVKLDNMDPLLFNIADMNQSMKSMTVTTGVMSRDMNKMSRPWRIMNNMVP